MKFTVDLLEKLMASPREGANLEFKEAKNQYNNDKLLQYCVALANEEGGFFILGVTNTPPRKVIGTSAFENIEKITSQIFNKLRFRVDVHELKHPDGRVLIFEVPPRPRGMACQYDGRYLMRSGEELVAMTPDKLRRIFDEGKPDFLQGVAVSGIDGADVVHMLDTQSYFDLIHLPYPENRQGVLDRFERESLIVAKNGRYDITNLGAVLFAKSLNEFPALNRKAPRLVVYEGNNKLNIRLDQRGDKGYAVGFEGLVDYINAQVPTNEVIEKAIRKTVKMFPEIAIRELVANAMIHQDFNETGASVSIEVYGDRIEISNPGLPLIPPERFIDEYQSRNEKLADIMRRMGICEELGSGIDKVIQSSEIFQLPAPDFRVGECRTTIVLFAHQEFNKMGREDRIRACYQHCFLRYVMNEKMTNTSLRERFNLTEKKADLASKVIRDTIEKSWIKLEDPESASRRYARYIPFWA